MSGSPPGSRHEFPMALITFVNASCFGAKDIDS